MADTADPFAEFKAADAKTAKASVGTSAPAAIADPFAEFKAADAAAPAKPADWGASLKSFGKAAASNVLPGFAEIPEQSLNVMQYLDRRNLHFLPPAPQAAMSAALPPMIDMFNKAAGAYPSPYVHAAETMRQNPVLGLFGGQSPDQLAQQNQLGGMAGTALGQLPAFAAMGGLGVAAKAPLAAKVGMSALEGGLFSSGSAAAETASKEAQETDQLDAGQIAGAAAQSFLPGVMFGGGARVLGEGIGAGLRKLFPPKLPTITPESHRIAPQPVITPKSHRLELHNEYALPDRTSPPGPKLIEKQLIPPSATDRARMENELYVPPFRHVEDVRGEVVPPKEAPKPTKKGEIKVTTDPPLPPPEHIQGRVEEIADPDKSWRGAREEAARPATAQETPLARDLGRNKINLDAIGSKLRDALRQLYAELRLKVPTRAQHLDPKYALELKRIAQELGGTPKAMAAGVESTLAPQSKFPESHVFTATTLKGKIEELKALSTEYNSAKSKYDNFKDRHAEEFDEKFPLNETIQVTVESKQYGPRTVNVRRRWQPAEYEFPTTAAESKFTAEKQARLDKSTPYEELTTPAFKKVIKGVLDKGDHLELEGLADAGAFDWFKKLGKANQTKLVLAIGAAAALYAGNQQEAEAAPGSKLAGKVVTALWKGGWREWAGSRPIVNAVKVNMTTDMVARAFDVPGKKYLHARMTYLADLTRANVGSRVMTAAEEEATRGMSPGDLRRTPVLVGWTQLEKQKAGDIAYLNQQHKAAVKIEMQRLHNLKVTPGQAGRAGTYARGVQIDGHDLGLHYKDADGGEINPLGDDNKFLNKLNAEVMQSELRGNHAAAIYHTVEAVAASASKYKVAFAQTLHGLATNPVYKEFAIANSPPGFFEMLVQQQKGNGFKGPWGIRKKFNDAINEPLDNWLKAHIGEVGYEAISANLGERGKLGLNQTVIAVHFAGGYPGGPERYMADWLAHAKRRTPVPQQRQAPFAKVALNAMIDSNKATATLPNGPIKERTVFQRTQAWSIVVNYTKGTTNQSRFYLSLFDDLLSAAARKDLAGIEQSISAIVVFSLLIGAAAGSHAVPPIIWATLEQLNRAKDGTIGDVEHIKHAIDDAQSHVAFGYQMQHVGIRGTPLASLPTGAISSAVQSVSKLPTNTQGYVKDAAIGTALTLTSRIGPLGLSRATYMGEQMFQGFTGSKDFKAYLEGAANVFTSKAIGRSTVTAEGNVPFGKTQGLLHAFANIQNPDELKILRQGEKEEAGRWPGDVRELQDKVWHGLTTPRR